MSEILTDIDGYKSDSMTPAYLMTSAAVPKSQRISGIVIDAREHAVDPSMSPEELICKVILSMEQLAILGLKRLTEVLLVMLIQWMIEM